jgi:hypothetical protein
MTDENTDKPDLLQRPGIIALGIYFFVLSALLFYFLVSTWPIANAEKKLIASTFFLWDLPSETDTRLFLTVIAAGAVGSLIHTLTSFGDYVGNQRLSANWVWWFILRMPIGIALALLFYLVLRGGLIMPSSNGGTLDTTNINVYGIAAISAMAGMFSKQATDKLREVFETLFRPREPVDRADPLVQGMPVISSTTPATLKVGVPSALTVTGRGFQPACNVLINGNPRDSQRTSDTQLTVTVVAADVANAGQPLQLIVENPGQRGGKSAPFTVPVEP